MLCLLGVVTSCGSQSGEGTVASSAGAFDWAQAVDGLSLSGPLTSFVVANDSWAAVVDGGIDSTKSGLGSLRFFSKETGPEGQEFALPGDTPRFLPFAWQSGSDEISVVSAACPAWEAGSPPPAFERDQRGWLDKGCGNSTFDLWTWSRSDQRWREVARGLFTAPDGVDLNSSMNERLIVSFTPPETDPEKLALNVFHLIDSAKGTMSPLPAPPDNPRMEYLRQCFMADGSILMGAGITTLEGGTVEREPSERPGVDLFTLQGDEWQPVEIDYRAATAAGCDSESGLVLRNGTSIALVNRSAEGRITSQEVAIPDGYAGVEHRIGGPVLFQTDSEGTTTVSTLIDGSWKNLGPVRKRDSAFSYVVNGGFVDYLATDATTPSSPVEARS